MIIGPTVDETAEYYRLPGWSGSRISTCPRACNILTDAEESLRRCVQQRKNLSENEAVLNEHNRLNLQKNNRNFY
jgi:hypothetical protein